MKVAVGLTGASGAVYAIRLVEELLQKGHRVHLIPSKVGLDVLKRELQVDNGKEPVRSALKKRLGQDNSCLDNLRVWEIDDFTAPFASGSNPPDAMVVVPCSMGTLAGIAIADAGNLLRRCADVTMKERKPLIIVPRETPLSAIHLEHMLRLARLGVTILPAVPGFYHKPKTVDDLVDFVVARILDQLGVEHELVSRWGD